MREKSIPLSAIFILCVIIAAGQPVCEDSLPVSLLRNPSFEEFSGCNTRYVSAEGGIIDFTKENGGVAVQGWHGFTLNFTPRYFNYNCKSSDPFSIFNWSFFSTTAPYYPAVPMPLPDGDGFISIIQKGYNANEAWSTKTYITQCLSEPLQAGADYVFNFYFAFGKLTSAYPPIPWASCSPFRIGLFGRADCPDYPFRRDEPDSAIGCLTNRSGWTQLGMIELSGGKDEWVQGTISFTAPFDIHCIGVGPDCFVDSHIGDTTAWYYLDKFTLASKEDFAYEQIEAISGNPCDRNYVLKAPFYENANYSWYKDGNLITNAHTQLFHVSNNEEARGDYTVNIVLPDNTCLNTLPFRVEFSAVDKVNLGNDRSVCGSQTVLLNVAHPTLDSYLWNDQSQESFLFVKESGNYWVEVKDIYGCIKRDSMNVQFKKCDSCSFFIPTAFTPNNDGLNDVFRVKPTCPHVKLKNFRMSIYNKLGQKVFETTDVNEGWNGMRYNYSQPHGVYAYSITYYFNENATVKKGTVTLLQ